MFSHKTIFSRKWSRRYGIIVDECFENIKKQNYYYPLFSLLLSFLYTLSFTNQKDWRVGSFNLCFPCSINYNKMKFLPSRALIKEEEEINQICMVFLYLVPLCFYNWRCTMIGGEKWKKKMGNWFFKKQTKAWKNF